MAAGGGNYAIGGNYAGGNVAMGIPHWRGNTVIGLHSDAYGDNNTILGADNIVHGHNNVVIGTGNVVHGDNNVIIGNNRTINGDNHYIFTGDTGILITDDNLQRMMLFAAVPLVADVRERIIQLVYHTQTTRKQLLMHLTNTLRTCFDCDTYCKCDRQYASDYAS